MLPQEEGICLGACEAGAVDSGLLTGTHAHCLAVIGKADGIGLGVFEGNEGDDQIDLCTFGQLLVFGNNVLKQLAADLKVVPTLLEGDAEDHLGLLLGGNVVRINGYYIVIALALGL